MPSTGRAEIRTKSNRELFSNIRQSKSFFQVEQQDSTAGFYHEGKWIFFDGSHNGFSPSSRVSDTLNYLHGVHQCTKHPEMIRLD